MTRCRNQKTTPDSMPPLGHLSITPITPHEYFPSLYGPLPLLYGVKSVSKLSRTL
jgi:hypothetical protein